MPQFDPQTFSPQLVWLLISLSLLLGVMTGYLAPRLFAFIGFRRDAQALRQKQTQEINVQTEALKAEYQALLAEAKRNAEAEVNELLQQVRDDYGMQRRKHQGERDELTAKLEKQICEQQKVLENALAQEIRDIAATIQAGMSNTSGAATAD